MNDMTITRTRDALDELLRPFEARPATRTPEGVVAARVEADLGHQLARIQGAGDNLARQRLHELVILGKATRQEVLMLGAEIARRGLFNERHSVEHDR
jgi:hypothetical protein